jgi:hypothetical protein
MSDSRKRHNFLLLKAISREAEVQEERHQRSPGGLAPIAELASDQAAQ